MKSVFISLMLGAMLIGLFWAEPRGVAAGVTSGGLPLGKLPTLKATRSVAALRWGPRRRLRLAVGSKAHTFTYSELGISKDLPDRVAAGAWKVGRELDLLPRLNSLITPEDYRNTITPVVRFDHTHGLERAFRKLAQAPSPARAVKTRSGWTLLGGTPGYEVDRSLAASIVAATVASGEETVELPVRRSSTVTGWTARLHKICSSSIDLTKKHPRSRHNASTAARLATGTIIPAGGVFSFNNTVGPRTTARGFVPAPAFRQGYVVDEPGGGVCATSSAFWVCFLKAGASVVERHPHGFKTASPPGLDAAVDYGVADLKMLNRLGSPVVLEARLVDGRLTASLYTSVTIPPIRVYTTRARQELIERVETIRETTTRGATHIETVARSTYKLARPRRKR